MPRDAKVPAFSVIVPVYRQWELVPALLAGLAAQTLPAARFEVILVNNAAPEPAPALALPANARILDAPAPGSYAARNVGAAAARGGWLAFTDADCRPDPGWLAALATAAEAGPSLLAGPVRVEAPTDMNPAAPNAYAIYDLVRGIPQARYVAHGYAATANLAVPAAVFQALGGFETTRFSGGDAVFCRRAGRAGHPLRLVAGATVAHPARANWDELVRKARRIKGGQIAAGPLPRRLAWTLRTGLPPLYDMAAYLAAPHPWRFRLTAAAIRLRLWGVELTETARLLAGRPPERR